MKKKVYVVGGATGYTRFLKNFELVDNLEDANLVLFTGGEDVTPSYYGCEAHRTTWNSEHRDKFEKEIFDKIRKDQFVVGICRGSQFLCVMNGGILVQNCDNHGVYGGHEITNGKEEYIITSTHHQMQFPYFLDQKDYDLLFWAKGRRSTYYEGDKVDPKLIEKNGEAEIVMYHKEDKPKCLAIQGHPEMIPDSPVSEMLNNLIDVNIIKYEQENN